MNRLASTLAMVAALALTAGCGSYAGSGGGGGSLVIGGVPGSACVPDVHAQGCSGTERVSCDVGTSLWVSAGKCAAGEICLGKPDPADPQGIKQISECKPIPGGGGDATVSDTTVAGDGGTTDTGVATDGGGQDTLGQDGTAADTSVDAGPAMSKWLKCVQVECAAQWGSCNGKPACKTAAWCVDACGPDKGCAQICINNAEGDDESALISVMLCADQSGCDPGPGGPKCGNGQCEEGESNASCPADCKATGPKCGNGQCEEGESTATCPADCKATGPKCGNGQCEEGETSSTCPADCKTAPQCGDGKCEGNETPQSCLADCKPVCGDGKCELGESKNTCPKDCGSNTVCGNNVCEPGETATSCASDCGPKPVCGNGTCETGETATSCAQDCGGGGSCLQQKCGTQVATCQNDKGCMAIVYYIALVDCADKFKCTDSACVQKNCSNEGLQCQNDSSCNSLLGCLGNCSSGDQTCANKCFGTSSVNNYDAVAQCAQSKCPNG